MTHGDNEWESNRKLILTMLDRLEEAAAATSKEVSKLATDMELLKDRAKMWGALMGIVSGAGATAIVQLLMRHG